MALKADTTEMTPTSLNLYLSLKSGVIYVPYSQRPYKWGLEQVKRMFDDYINAYKKDELHRMNFILVSTENGRNDLYDGQQRTITSLLMIAVILQDAYQLADDSDEDNSNLNDYVRRYVDHRYGDFFEDEFEKNDNGETIKKIDFYDAKTTEFFYSLVKFDSIPDDGVLGSSFNLTTSTMVKNYSQLWELWTAFVNENKIQLTDYENIVSDIVNNVNVFYTKTGTNAEAQMMFEALNNTGMPMEPMEVLKNDLARVYQDDVKMDSYWQTISHNLEYVSSDSFFNLMATLINGLKTQSISPLSVFYSKYPSQTKDQVTDALKVLEEYTRQYANVAVPKQMKNPDNNKDVQEYKEHMFVLNELFGMSQHFVLVTAMFLSGKYSMADMAEFVKGLEAFFVTRFMTKKLTPNAATILFIKPAREILDESKPKPTVKELLKRLNTDEKTTMTEDEVVDLLMVRDYGSGNARRNLKAIFVYLANTKVKPDAPIPMDMGVSDYEHILPGRPKKNSAWVQTLFPDEEQRKHDTHMLGNAALWYNKDNRGVQNAEFEVKKTYYADSSIPDTRDLAKLSTWDHDQVVKRTRKLAQEIADYFYQEY